MINNLQIKECPIELIDHFKDKVSDDQKNRYIDHDVCVKILDYSRNDNYLK